METEFCISRNTPVVGHKSWCGQSIRMAWHFVNVDHAADTVSRGDRQQPCRKCIIAIDTILRDGRHD